MLEVGIGIAIALIVLVIGFFFLRKMPESVNKTMLKSALLGLVTLAETKFSGGGRGAEKSEWVKSEIIKSFPQLKDNEPLMELIGDALEIAKNTVFDAAKKEVK